MMIVAHALLEANEKNRKIYLYGTFEGMSKPAEADYPASNKIGQAIFDWKNAQTDDHNDWHFSSLQEVPKNMFSTGYPEEQIKFVKGRVEDTIPGTIPLELATKTRYGLV